MHPLNSKNASRPRDLIGLIAKQHVGAASLNPFALALIGGPRNLEALANKLGVLHGTRGGIGLCRLLNHYAFGSAGRSAEQRHTNKSDHQSAHLLSP